MSKKERAKADAVAVAREVLTKSAGHADEEAVAKLARRLVEALPREALAA